MKKMRLHRLDPGSRKTWILGASLCALLAAVLFVICVAMKFHGSSIGVWNNCIISQPESSPYQFAIFGVPRPIRSDEWHVFTLHLTVEYLHELGVDYICMPVYQRFPTAEYAEAATQIYTDGYLGIYRLSDNR